VSIIIEASIAVMFPYVPQYSVAVPSQEPVVNSTLVSAHARFVSFEFKPPPAESWNGILGGYILSYTNHESDSTLKRTIDDLKQEVCLSVFCLIITARTVFMPPPV